MLSTRQGIINTIVGTSISIFNAIIQFLLIYFILESFGAEFNGFVRIVSSFSALIATSESAIGVATVLLLIRAMNTKDWITANEVYSTSKKNYRKSAMIMGLIMIIISLFYPLYVSVDGLNGIFNPDSWSNVGMNLSGTNTEFISYLSLFAITLFFGLKNFIVSYFFSVYENIIMADNKGAFTKIVILLSDIIVYTILLLLLSFDSINPIIIFLPILMYSPIRGLLCYLYVKKKYVWLKYYRDFNSYELNSISTKISNSSIGSTLLLNTDILILALILGLNVSSNVSLYMVIAVNIRLIMTNFITSFREYFVTIIYEKGRIYYKTYNKYELYSYLIAAFTFINMSLLSPYFVSSLYGDLANKSLNQNLLGTEYEATKRSLEFIFYSFKFSILYAGITSLAIMCESQMTLIQAKTSGAEVTKFQNILGVVYLILAFVMTSIFKGSRIGDDNYLVMAITALFVLKIIAYAIRYIYLWIYVYKYVTYNSTFKYSWRNFLVLFFALTITILIASLLLEEKYDIHSMTTDNSRIEPLVALFFISVFSSMFILLISALILNYQIMMGIFSSFPIIKRILLIKSNKNREKRLLEEGINVGDIVDNSNLLADAMETISITNELDNKGKK